MKKIIGGKLFDTDTAIYLGECESSGGRRDHSFFSESLYKTKKGRYFLHGEGGPASRYSKSIGLNTWSGGNDIIPLSQDEVLEWASDHLGPDKVIEIFGSKIEEA